jgi:branched-chain amino acid aminotransferase
MSRDFSELEGSLWLDGRMVRARDAKLHVLSHSLHFAGAVFEGIRAYRGRPFALEEHLERLAGSAELLGYELPFGQATLAGAVEAVLSENGLEDAYIRPIAWRGSQSISVPAAGTCVHVAIAAFTWPAYYPAGGRGLKLQMARWRRPSPATAPTQSKTSGLYAIATMARDEAARAGYDDALLLDWRGRVAEATGANLFLVIDDALHTPRAHGFLDGITRRKVIELARQRRIRVVERRIWPGELGSAQACFLTGTAVEVKAVERIETTSFDPNHPMIELLAGDYAALAGAAPAARLSESGAPRTAGRLADRPAARQPAYPPASPA